MICVNGQMLVKRLIFRHIARGLAGKRSAVMLANHGPVVAGADVEAACYAIEELEDTARLALLTHGMARRGLSDGQVRAVVSRFDVEWDD